MQTNKILRYAILTGIFLLPFICLIVSNYFFFPFITGKNFTFRIIVEIITGLWFILAIRDHTFLPKFTGLLQAFALFIGVIFISDFLSPNVYKSFWSNYERMEGWVTLAHLFALFVVTSSVMTKKLWDWLFRVSIGVSLIIFAYGSLQLAGKFAIHQGGVRLDATFGNATYLAVYMLFHILLNLILFIRAERGSLWRWFYGIAVLAELFILYHTATRGATLGLIGGLFLASLLILIFHSDNKKARTGAIGLVTGLVVLVGVFLFFKNADFVKNSPILGRFSSLSFTDKTAESRFMIWNMALQGFKERPIFGWGQESFNYVFNKYYDPRMYSQEQWFDRTHNVFFDWLIAGGLLGVLSYFSLFGFALYYIWRKGSPFSIMEKSLVTGLFAGYFFHNLTVFDNITSYILFIFVLAWINCSVGTAPSNLVRKLSAIDSGTRDRILIPIVSVGIVFVIYSVNVPLMLAATELIKALPPQPGGPAVNLEYYKKALSHETPGNSEIREQLVQATTQAGNVSGLDPKIKNDFFNLAKQEMLRQLEQTPQDARYFLFAGSFLSSYGDFDNGIKYLNQAHELSSKKQTILFSLGLAYIGKRDFPNAISVLKQAFELDQSFDEARKIYALALVYDKKLSVAEEILKPLNKESIFADQRFLIGYFSSGYFEKALESVNFLIQKNPSNIQYYTSRAAILVALGRRTAAIGDLNRVVEINPDAKAQVEYLIGQVRAGKNI